MQPCRAALGTGLGTGEAAGEEAACNTLCCRHPTQPHLQQFSQIHFAQSAEHTALVCTGRKRHMGIHKPCSPRWQGSAPPQHLEQVVPSPFGPFGPFVSFGSFLHGVAAERAANLLPPGERVVFLPRQLRGAVFVFLSLPVYSLPSGHALMCLCCWTSVGASSRGRLQLPAPWGRAVAPSRPWQSPQGHGSARCWSRAPPP